MRPKFLFYVFVLCAALGAGTAAEIIHTVPNSSFESRDLADGGFTAGSIPDWTVSNNNAGDFNPTDSHYSGASDSSGGTLPLPALGEQVAYSNHSTATIETQNALALLEHGRNYQLVVAVGERLDSPFRGYDLALLVGGGEVASITDDSGPVPTAGAFTDVTLTYDSPPNPLDSLVGEPVTIRLSARSISGSQTNFDNIRLTSTPEPATAVLLMMGLGLVTLRRRR